MLLENGLKVHQAATRVGISNVNYFHMKFKKYFWEAPSYYKARPSKEGHKYENALDDAA
ncbi:hypothetical protein [Paenibacillus sp. PL91]|uniref:hypothetical protein n=1 Tax=Paenibacillus sp. PL91 TaxID=2729538 RepID=UPI0021D51F9A|nr:hypothetical protein [Paenibacillus sp. PL91]